ncbi:MAG TPA: hypothetical protein VEA63_04720, partial [Opitutus sp.]|nr:hypothetical protein [Opitutus sp.]
LDTRPGHAPGFVAALRSDVDRFFHLAALPTTCLTGNHDPDFSAHHHLELANGGVFLTHGDILFEDIVPWSQDARLARDLVAAELAKLSPAERHDVASRLSAYRRAAFAIPQRHQSAPRGLQHLLGLAQETIWPPTRVFRILRAWREVPSRVDRFLREHRPNARFFIMGHTHRLGALRTAGGIVVLNTGSFCPPGGGGVIDLTPDSLSLRRVERSGAGFRLGRTLAEFSLARP